MPDILCDIAVNALTFYLLFVTGIYWANKIQSNIYNSKRSSPKMTNVLNKKKKIEMAVNDNMTGVFLLRKQKRMRKY